MGSAASSAPRLRVEQVESNLIVLVRHADAGDRNSFAGDDYLRSLTPKGEWQAQTIATWLSRYHPARVVSSRAKRCVLTVAPLASVAHLEVEELDELSEGSDPRAALKRLLELCSGLGGTLVACSHGDVIPGIVELLAERGVPHGDIPKIKKGAAVLLTVTSGEVVAMEFVDAPRFQTNA